MVKLGPIGKAMFSSDSDTKVPVEIVLTDGTILVGKMDGGATKNITVVLNREGNFLELFMHGGLKKQLSKQHIMSVEMTEEVKVPELKSRAGLSDPYNILKIEAGADPATIKAAYIRLCKQYHPDTYQGIDMPPELKDYVEQMFRLVNFAYRQVSGNARHAA